MSGGIWEYDESQDLNLKMDSSLNILEILQPEEQEFLMNCDWDSIGNGRKFFFNGELTYSDYHYDTQNKILYFDVDYDVFPLTM